MKNEETNLDTAATSAAAIAGMQQVMNVVRSPMYSVDSAYNIVAVNEALAKAIGKNPADCVGQKCSTLFKSHECANGNCAVKRAMLLQNFQSSETQAQFNGKLLPVTFEVTPIINSKGEVAGAVNLIKDLSDYHGPENEIRQLKTAALEGKLSVRADPTRFTGDSRKMIENVNEILDAVIRPLNVTAEYVDRISKGDIPQKITEDYNGDFNEIKNNMNHLIDVVNHRNADINLLINAAIEGKLDTRADVSKYSGANGRMVAGINSILDAVIGPLHVTADCIDRISRGDLPQKITDKYNGDFNDIKNNLNNLIDVVNMRNADINVLIRAASEGQLGTRADVSKYPGYNGKMIGGINNMFDVMVGPINEAMRVSHEFANCNFKARVNDELPVKGDFLKFKNALNEIGISVSRTIDLVDTQANEYANCNFTARIDDSANVHGDFVAIRDSLNNVGVQVSKALNVVNQQVVDLAANAQQANASATEVSSGSAQVARNVTAVSTNAEKGAEGIRQILKAMEDLSANVQEVASSTESVSRLAKDTNVLSATGADQAYKAEQGMASITKSSAEVDAIIVEIKIQMDKIGKIVSLITNLANQTNLLALNAAIEAARAGEAGRGFAVVASEVKSLAQESRQSAENIAEMIGTLQQKSAQAAAAMGSATREVKDGSAALTETLDIFNRIVKSVEKISTSMDEVAKASEAQAAVVEEVTASVNDVSSNVQNTAKEAMDAAAASEESSASVEQIARVIGNVNGIVENVSAETAKFRI